MSVTFKPIRVEDVINTVKSLEKAIEQMMRVAAEMQRPEMKGALVRFTPRQLDSLDAIIILASQCAAILPSLLIAKDPISLAPVPRTPQRRERK